MTTPYFGSEFRRKQWEQTTPYFGSEFRRKQWEHQVPTPVGSTASNSES